MHRVLLAAFLGLVLTFAALPAPVSADFYRCASCDCTCRNPLYSGPLPGFDGTDTNGQCASLCAASCSSFDPPSGRTASSARSCTPVCNDDSPDIGACAGGGGAPPPPAPGAPACECSRGESTGSTAAAACDACVTACAPLGGMLRFGSDAGDRCEGGRAVGDIVPPGGGPSGSGGTPCTGDACETAETSSSTPAAAPAPTLPNPLGGSTDIRSILGRIIAAALGISGSIALLMFVWGGMLWLTSAGNPERIKKGKDTIVWAVMGLVLIFGSYAVLNFVLGTILGAA